jgi:hypothetical protein
MALDRFPTLSNTGDVATVGSNILARNLTLIDGHYVPIQKAGIEASAN